MTEDEDWYDEAAASAPRGGQREDTLGPVFVAQFETDSVCCGNRIVPGEDARADGHGAWLHADTQCEAMVTGRRATPRGTRCPRCFLIHARGQGECK
jgi:hypothetical protein